MRLLGKRAIITGAASGMGRAGSLLFAREGARVFAVDVDGPALALLQAEIAQAGGQLATLVADLSVADEVARMVRACDGALGGIDVLWSHAGINGPSNLEQLDVALYKKTLALNITAAVLACGQVAPVMRRNGGGAMVLTSSVAGLVGSIQNPIYSATKFALVGLAKSLALRFAPEGIRVNALCPGPIDSPMLRDLIAGRTSVPNGAELGAKLLASIPMGRFGAPHEIAEAALWLASDAASFVTGIALPVDGGVTAR